MGLPVPRKHHRGSILRTADKYLEWIDYPENPDCLMKDFHHFGFDLKVTGLPGRVCDILSENDISCIHINESGNVTVPDADGRSN